jgi:hypothetical protein
MIGDGRFATRTDFEMDIITSRSRGRAGQLALSASIMFALASFLPGHSWAAPSAEAAKKCMRYSYIAFPYQRPGAAPMNGNRQAYFKDCLARDGNVPPPSPPQPKS